MAEMTRRRTTPPGNAALECALQRRLMELSAAVQNNTDVQHLRSLLGPLAAIVGCVLESDTWRKALFSPRWRPAMGHLLHILLGLFEETRDVALRQTAADLIIALTKPAMRDDSSQTLALVLPGLCARCHRIALQGAAASTSTSVQPSLDAMKIISQSICSTMFNGAGANSRSNASDLDVPGQPSIHLQAALTQTEGWFVLARKSITPSIATLSSLLCTSPDYRIRLQLLEMTMELHNECCDVLGEGLQSTLMDLLHLLYDDDSHEVRYAVERQLKKLRAEDEAAILKLMGKKLSTLCRTFTSGACPAQRRSDLLSKLTNCALMLGQKPLERLLAASDSLAEGVLDAILCTIRVDSGSLLITPIHTADDTGGDPLRHVPLRDGVIRGQLKRLADFLTSTDYLETTMIDALEKRGSMMGTAERIASAYFATLLAGSAGRGDNAEGRSGPLRSLIAYFTEQLARLEDLHLFEGRSEGGQAAEDDTDTVSPTLDQACLAAILLQGVGQAAIGLPEDTQHRMLVEEALYELLKWAAAPNPMVGEAAETAIKLMSTQEKHHDSTAEDFLRAHATHVLNKVGITLHDGAKRGLAAVLAVSELLRLGPMTPTPPPDFTEQLCAVINELMCAFDRRHHDNEGAVLLLLRALRTYVRVLVQWHPDMKPSAVADRWTGLREDAEGRLPQVPEDPLVESVVAILQRTRHMISSESAPVQLLVLELMEAALRFVRNFEDHLLPMIHQNWHGLIRRLEVQCGRPERGHHPQLVLATKAIGVVTTMCGLSGSFVYRKVVDELVPRLTHLMSQFHPELIVPNRCYTQTASYRFQMAAVKSIPLIAVKCGLSRQDVRPLVDVLRRIITSCIYPELREAAARSMKDIEEAMVSSSEEIEN